MPSDTALIETETAMTRRTAYLGALKYYFQNGLCMEGWDRRKAWSVAKRYAAEYAFNVSTASLTTVSVEV
jgi:hypothetical protein